MIEAQSFADQSNRFALALYNALRDSKGNLFFSPFSIRLALAMASAGARGETATQLARALHLPASHDICAQVFATATGTLSRYNSRSCALAIANSLWAQYGDDTLLPEFVEVLVRCYRGELCATDFARATDAVRAINSWVAEKTRHKIREIVSPRHVCERTRMVIVNAMFFKGTWQSPFEANATRNEPFFAEGSREVLAPLMRQHVSIGHVQSDGYQAIELPYRGDDLSMLVLLPDRKPQSRHWFWKSSPENSLADLERRLTVEALNECVAGMSHTEVELFLPRVSLRWRSSVLDRLASLGVTDLFDPNRADLSGINGRRPPDPKALWVSEVIHEAVADVDEMGTEAAAATAVVFDTVSMMAIRQRPIVFRADHPFVFAIRERRSGTILFLGRLSDPTS